MSRLTAVKASNPQQGHLHATLDQMTGEEAGEMAELMWNLIYDLLTTRATGGLRNPCTGLQSRLNLVLGPAIRAWLDRLPFRIF
ncbi:hypothetical protein [Mesorhizobium kowhaii]|uniref:Uncharacterized protein n=1 Tax=Mesorhizobium kowhaii TaxID=1300272 RepID=A0A2W7C2F9_9HYPH|nr:hypothetical protein [Mesorhizobium kowhaii]PZV37127.1 hypothetical protein B5V02_18145 [Mesorhizobium kowhaii]